MEIKKSIHSVSIGIVLILCTTLGFALFVFARAEAAPSGSFASGPPASCSATELGGNVFRDYNANAVQDSQEPNFVSIITSEVVTISAYDDTNTEVATAQTGSDGRFQLTGLVAGQNYRIEIKDMPKYLEVGAAHSGGSDSTVTFASAGDCSSKISVNSPADWCQSVDQTEVAAPCYVLGDPSQGGDIAGYPSFHEIDESLTTPTGLTATNTDIGATWGAAYDSDLDVYYTAAFLRRHSAYGPDGAGAIYAIDSTGSVTTVYDDNSLTTESAVSRGLATNQNDASTDDIALQLFGKRAYGDIELHQGSGILYAVDLENRQIQKIDVDPSSPTLGTNIGNVPITAPMCQNSQDWIPFALTIKDDRLHLGVTCNGPTAGVSQGQLESFVQAYDIDTDTYMQDIYSYDYDYVRDSVDVYHSSAFDWVSFQATTDAANPWYLPSPILMDVDFDSDNSLILGVGHVLGYTPERGSGGTGITRGVNYGDVLRACYDSATSTYSDVSAPNCVNPNPNTNQGVLGPEFYVGDTTDTSGHNERALGGIVNVPGRENMITTGFSAELGSYHSGGLMSLSNSDGGMDAAYNVYDVLDTAYGAKTSGMGDIEAACGSAPIEIGNRIWLDLDKDGIQDPSEVPMAGVTVELVDDSGSVVATAVTDADGNYLFTSWDYDHPDAWTSIDPDPDTSDSEGIVPGGVAVNSDYTVRVDTTQAPLTDYALTLTDIGGGSNPDYNDNDGAMSGNYAVVAVSTQAAGNNNHTLDFGFYEDEKPVYDLALIKTIATEDQPVYEGDTVTFTMEVTNQGNQPAQDIVVSDYIPEGFELTAANQGSWDAAASGPATVNQTIAGPIAPGASEQVTIDLTVTSAATAGELTNVSEISAFTDTSGATQTDIDSTPDTDQANDNGDGDDTDDDDKTDGNAKDNAGEDEDDHDSEDVVVNLRQIDLTIEKQLVGSTTVYPGDTVEYTLVASNNGPDSTTDPAVVVQDQLPAELTFVSAAGTDWTCTNSGQDITCTRSSSATNLAASDSAETITVTATVDSATVAGSYDNFAQVNPGESETLVETNLLGTDNNGYETGDPATDSNNDDKATLSVEIQGDPQVVADTQDLADTGNPAIRSLLTGAAILMAASLVAYISYSRTGLRRSKL